MKFYESKATGLIRCVVDNTAWVWSKKDQRWDLSILGATETEQVSDEIMEVEFQRDHPMKYQLAFNIKRNTNP